MPYALFAKAVQVSKAFPTKAEVWDHAAAQALVIEVSSAEEDPPRRMLKMGFTIDLAAPESSKTAARDAHSLARMFAGCAVSLPSAAAAS